MVKVKRALISVSDKTGLLEFVKGLKEFGVEMLASGGTAGLLEKNGIKVRQVSDYTKSPEMLDGRVKTLHPKIHGALLSLRENPEHMKQVKEQGIELIDMVVVNLYPFEKTVADPKVHLEEAIENIDIGGPSMLRSGSKNYKSVAVICNPARYTEVLNEMKKNNGEISDATLANLALEVFERTSAYDRAIFEYLKSKEAHAAGGCGSSELGYPETITFSYKKAQDLRYGENPHQRAAFYKNLSVKSACVSNAKQLHGKELSYNNIYDLDAAFEIAKAFEEPSCVIIKHANPCGVATAKTSAQAFKDAHDCDPISAFGGVIGFNRKVDAETAKLIAETGFKECVIAPSFDKEAFEILTAKKNIRLLETGPIVKEASSEPDLKKVTGGILVQDKDEKDILSSDLKMVTKKQPTKDELASLLFGWKVVKFVKSNAIVLCQGTKTVGIGAGQMSRVDSTFMAIHKAGDKAKGSTLASDAFFPKEDAVELAAKAGIKAVIQPGGSIEDQAVINVADNAGISMVLTGMRHFRH